MNSKPNITNIKQDGFTLIELLVVIVIIGILGSVVVPKFLDKPDEARVAKAIHDITALESALDVYRLDNYFYPSTDQGLEALVAQPSGEPEPANWKQGGYIKKLRNDPWGNPYIYFGPDGSSDLNIVSLGADGAEGGDGVSKDISSQDIE